MLTRIVKWCAIAALIGSAFLHSAPGFALTLQIVVVVAAAIVVGQAANMRRYVWMSMFFVVACLFNPVFPIPFSTNIFLGTSTLAVVLFFFSLNLLQPSPRLSLASITNPLPGSESL